MNHAVRVNKKISVGVAISLIAIACTVTFVVTWTVAFNMYNDMIPVGKRDEINAKIQEIDAFLQNNFLFFDEIDEARVDFEMFWGYISGVGDKNTFYMTAEEYTNRMNIESGWLVTAGIKAQVDSAGDIVVAEVYSDSDAETQGVLRGDIITAIGGIDVRSVEREAAIRFLDGEEKTRVELTIQRGGELIPFSLIRQAIEIISVDYTIANEIGFVRISTFSERMASQFESALQDFADAGVRALTIDVRGNSSDIYTPVQSMVNLLIGANTVAFEQRRGGVRRDFITTDSSLMFAENIPVIVLTDSGTSGAGELVAAILKSFGGAQIVGLNTAGNSYLQETKQLRDFSAIRVTVARIELSSGLEYANVGLRPDYEVPMDFEVSYDVASLDNIETITDPHILKAFEIIDTLAPINVILQ
jgi:carboxyl-terminal processing protease